MRIAVDLNVLLDVAQNRVPHYQASEEVLARARRGDHEAVISGHAVTTLFSSLVVSAAELAGGERGHYASRHEHAC